MRMSTEPASPVDPTVQALLAERRRRLEDDKKQKDAVEKAENIAKAQSRREALVADPHSAKAQQAQYARETREKLQQEKLEKQRILLRIAGDRATQLEKGREQEEKKQRQAAAISVRRAKIEGRKQAGILAPGSAWVKTRPREREVQKELRETKAAKEKILRKKDHKARRKVEEQRKVVAS